MELTLPPQLDTGTALRYLGAAGWDARRRHRPAAGRGRIRPARRRHAAGRLAAAAPLGAAAGGGGARPGPPPAGLHRPGADGRHAGQRRRRGAAAALPAGRGAGRGGRRGGLGAAGTGLRPGLRPRIRAAVAAQGLHMTGRYSPGYGDCPLALQQELCLALDTVRGIGLCLTTRIPDDAPQKRHRHPWHRRPSGHRRKGRLRHLRAARRLRLPKKGDHLCN